jgi:hypothetical protein
MTTGARSAATDGHVRLFSSDDKSLSIQLSFVGNGIIVERTHVAHQRPPVCHLILLASHADLDAWMEADPLRLTCPFVFASAVRQVNEWLACR